MDPAYFPAPAELGATTANAYLLRAKLVLEDGTVVRPDWRTAQIAVWTGSPQPVTADRVAAARQARAIWERP